MSELKKITQAQLNRALELHWQWLKAGDVCFQSTSGAITDPRLPGIKAAEAEHKTQEAACPA